MTLQQKYRGQTAEELADVFLANSVRSAEFRLGLLAALRIRMHDQRNSPPFKLGSVEADAYYAGKDYGYWLWPRLQEGAAESPPKDAEERRKEQDR